MAVIFFVKIYFYLYAKIAGRDSTKPLLAAKNEVFGPVKVQYNKLNAPPITD